MLFPKLNHLIFSILTKAIGLPPCIGRRLGTMEVIYLITGETICNSSATVNFLPTELPLLQSKTILPVSQLLYNPDNPYYPDAIEKYFRRPHGNDFEHLKYEEYYQLYNIRTVTTNVTNRAIRDSTIG